MADIQEAQVKDAKGKKGEGKQAGLPAGRGRGRQGLVWAGGGLCRRSQGLCSGDGSQSCPTGGVPLPRAIMVQWVTVLDAEISATAVAGQFHHFPLPAASAFTLIGEDLTFLLSWI